MLKVGQTIKIVVYDEENVKHNKRKKKIEKWKIEKIHPHVVACVNAKGFRRSFSIGDLVVHGLYKQSEHIEFLRK